MKNPHRTTAYEMHLVAMTDKKGKHSPPDDKLDRSGRGIEKSALDKLLEMDKEFHPTTSKELADILVRMKIPPFLIEDLVQEAWLSAVQHSELFDQFEAREPKRRLLGFLTKVVHDKAVDILRRLDCYPCESLDAEEAEPIDDAEAKHAKAAEQREWLETLLAKIRPGHEDNVLLFRLHFFEEYSIQQLAQKFGITTDAVDGRVRRLMNKLREAAEGSLEELADAGWI